MVKLRLLLTVLVLTTLNARAQDFEVDKFETTVGPLEITFIGHGSFMMKVNDKIIHVDPSTREANYEELPDADLVLITHHHGDHCDAKAVEAVKKEGTKIITTQLAVDNLGYGDVLASDGSTEALGLTIVSIPAYNLVHKRDNGESFHAKGTCNSYIITIGDKRIFIGGDTENTPEMKSLQNIDMAFLPMNLPYTMTPEMVADAAKAFKPRILYPYHYGQTDTKIIVELMKDVKGVETRIRKMP